MGWLVRGSLAIVVVVVTATDSTALSLPCESLTAPPGAVFLTPDAAINSVFNGNSFQIDGNDFALDGAPGPAPAVYGMAARTAANAQEAIDSLGSAQRDNVLGKGFLWGPPTVPSIGVDGTLDGAMLNDFVANLLSLGAVVNTTTNFTGSGSLGHVGAPVVTYLPGAGTGASFAGTANWTGAGILIVEDELEVLGTLHYDGLILVKGPLGVTGYLSLNGSVWADGVGFLVGGSALVRYSSEALALASAAGGSQACLTSVCGDGTRTGLETCDDGNTTDGDCCSSTCTLEPNGASCNDGDACTDADTCANGICAGGAPVACGFCAQCDSALGCIGAPAASCRAPVAGKSQLTVRRTDVDVANRLTWRWRSRQGTIVDDFGDPVFTDDYTLCLFGGPSGTTLLSRTALLAGSLCGDRTCWSPTGRGWRWKDRERRTGVASLKLGAASTGKASIRVLGGGVSLELAALPVEPPVLVQLRAGDGACWEAAYSGVEQTDSSLRARSFPQSAAPMRMP